MYVHLDGAGEKFVSIGTLGEVFVRMLGGSMSLLGCWEEVCVCWDAGENVCQSGCWA